LALTYHARGRVDCTARPPTQEPIKRFGQMTASAGSICEDPGERRFATADYSYFGEVTS
jgi:hypothetical protein